MSEERQRHPDPAEGADEAVEAHGAERAAEEKEQSTGGEAPTTEHQGGAAEGTGEDTETPSAERADEQRAGEGTHEGSHGRRTEEEVEKEPMAEGVGLVEGENEGDWEGTAQKVRQQPTDHELHQQESAQHEEGREEEDKGFLDKMKDKLKGE